MRSLAQTSKVDVPVFTRSEIRVLLTLYRLGAFDRPNSTWVTQVAHVAQMPLNNVTRAVNRLLKKGLVQEKKQKVKGDRDAVFTYMRLIWLTERGRELAELLAKLAEDP